MYTNANVSLEDKLMSMENNIFKLTFAFITQLCVIFFMWLAFKLYCIKNQMRKKKN